MTSITPMQEKLPGTRPAGVHDEREAAARVQEMFAKIAPRYDFLNHLLSFSLDHVWRRRTAKKFASILANPEALILDLCCGTGDLAFALDRARARMMQAGGAPRRAIIGSDFVQGMLTRAREKAGHKNASAVFVTGDSMNLPFADANFDLATTAFGFRNLANYEHGLREIARVLKPGGEMGILEFTEPASGLTAALFRFYFKNILPRIGGAISGNSEAYAYLPGSVARFPQPAELARLMEAAGFSGVEIATWNFGSVVLHSARKA